MVNIDASRLHRFTPSRPDGVVCVAERIVFMNQDGGMATVCGYPAGHPIHGVYVQPNAEPLHDLDIVRGIVAAYVDNGDESYTVAMAALKRIEITLRADGAQ